MKKIHLDTTSEMKSSRELTVAQMGKIGGAFCSGATYFTGSPIGSAAAEWPPKPGQPNPGHNEV